MYVPGNDQKKIQKVTSLDLDCAVLDCEDGVAANKKVVININLLLLMFNHMHINVLHFAAGCYFLCQILHYHLIHKNGEG